jgi:hypothetical protein
MNNWSNQTQYPPLPTKQYPPFPHQPPFQSTDFFKSFEKTRFGNIPPSHIPEVYPLKPETFAHVQRLFTERQKISRDDYITSFKIHEFLNDLYKVEGKKPPKDVDVAYYMAKFGYTDNTRITARDFRRLAKQLSGLRDFDKMSICRLYPKANPSNNNEKRKYYPPIPVQPAFEYTLFSQTYEKTRFGKVSPHHVPRVYPVKSESIHKIKKLYEERAKYSREDTIPLFKFHDFFWEIYHPEGKIVPKDEDIAYYLAKYDFNDKTNITQRDFRRLVKQLAGLKNYDKHTICADNPKIPQQYAYPPNSGNSMPQPPPQIPNYSMPQPPPQVPNYSMPQPPPPLPNNSMPQPPPPLPNTSMPQPPPQVPSYSMPQPPPQAPNYSMPQPPPPLPNNSMPQPPPPLPTSSMPQPPPPLPNSSMPQPPPPLPNSSMPQPPPPAPNHYMPHLPQQFNQGFDPLQNQFNHQPQFNQMPQFGFNHQQHFNQMPQYPPQFQGYHQPPQQQNTVFKYPISQAGMSNFHNVFASYDYQRSDRIAFNDVTPAMNQIFAADNKNGPNPIEISAALIRLSLNKSELTRSDFFTLLNDLAEAHN